MAKDFLKQYEVFFKKATVDLNSAKIILEYFESGKVELDLEVIMFHLQQSVEKFIKVLLDYNLIKFPHSHDIEELILLINANNIKIINDIENFIPLSEYAVEGRYSIILDDIDDVGKYIEQLEELSNFVKGVITN